MINLYIDADDTILKSSCCVIDILNKRYNLYPKKSFEDLTDWNYRSIAPLSTVKEISDIYDSDEFFECVEVDETFKKIYEKYKKIFNFFIVTKGSKKNLNKKKAFFHNNFPDIKFIGLIYNPEDENFDKSIVDMRNGIQIDDRVDSLKSSNASRKILIKNHKNFYWNDTSHDIIEDLYIAQDWDDIWQFLNFTAEHPEWLEE